MKEMMRIGTMLFASIFICFLAISMVVMLCYEALWTQQFAKCMYCEKKDQTEHNSQPILLQLDIVHKQHLIFFNNQKNIVHNQSCCNQKNTLQQIKQFQTCTTHQYSFSRFGLLAPCVASWDCHLPSPTPSQFHRDLGNNWRENLLFTCSNSCIYIAASN